jgi:hypothetical protein
VAVPVPEAMSSNGGSLAATILLLTTVPNNYSGVLPSMFTISSDFFHGQGSIEGNRKRIRQGEVIGSALTVAEGLAVSALTRSLFPLVGAVAMGAFLVGCYEYSLRNPAKAESPLFTTKVSSALGWRQWRQG